MMQALGVHSRAWLLIGLVLALAPSAWLVWNNRDMPAFGAMHDDTIYLTTAKALAEGHGYRIESLPSAPLQTKYPPLYAALLSLVWRANPHFPDNIAWFSWAAWMAMPLFGAAVFFAMRRLGLGDVESAALSFLILLNQTVLWVGMTLMPDMAFAALAIAGLVLLDDERPVAAGVLSAAAFLLKPMNLWLLASVPLVCLLRRRFRVGAQFLAVFAPVAAAWMLWSRLNAPPKGIPLALLYYSDYAAFHLRIGAPQHELLLAWENLASFFSQAGNLLVPELGFSGWGLHFSRIVTAAALAGAVKLVRARGRWHYAAFALIYFGQNIFWHSPPADRFLFPLLPLLAAGLYTQLGAIVARIRIEARAPAWSNRIAAAAFTAAMVAFVGFTLYQTAMGAFVRLPKQRTEFRARNAICLRDIARLNASVPVGASIVSGAEQLIYLHTGHRGVRPVLNTIPYYTGDREGMRQRVLSAVPLAASEKLDYIFLTAFDFEMLPADEDLPALYHRVASDPRVEPMWRTEFAALFRVKR